jgi:hypothetical protein
MRLAFLDYPPAPHIWLIKNSHGYTQSSTLNSIFAMELLLKISSFNEMNLKVSKQFYYKTFHTFLTSPLTCFPYF